ncbi:uncharacterized protein [Anabrus simplex]|uniref:uncharacterized protein isoform X2 n=1 Tax=Anabrus simplex TaxID=316456 RepID=UPI0035A298DE
MEVKPCIKNEPEWIDDTSQITTEGDVDQVADSVKVENIKIEQEVTGLIVPKLEEGTPELKKEGDVIKVELTCEGVPSLDKVPAVGDCEVMTPVPSTSSHLPSLLIASPSPSPRKRSISRGQKRKLIVQEEEKLLQQATSVLDSVIRKKQQLSDLDAVGLFVSSSLKQLKNKALVIQGKREIFDVIQSLQEEDHRLRCERRNL